MTRLLATAVAVVLLLVHRVTPHDPALIVAVIAYTAGSLVLLTAVPRLQASPAAWLADGAVALALVAWSEDWRSPFYVLMLTALILPSTGQPFRRALGWGLAFALAYLGVAVYTELDANTLESTIRLETIATHLMVPLVVVLALAYAADVLERLRDERLRSERLAVESERQRIAWELHDSAKQRVHAAHLVLSALQGQVDGAQAQLVGHALAELRAAGADMDTSVAELRTPLEGRSVQRLLEERAAELAPGSDAQISVRGTLGELPAHVAAHVYRIGAEALTNAVRHGDAEHVDVVLARNGSCATIEVRDDGRGLPAIRRPGSNGLRSMRARADTIGATLSLGPGDGGRGTSVVVVLDYHLPGDDGLVLCRRIKRQVPAPAVLLYSAYAEAALTIPARLAGADGLVSKSAPANELFDAIRRVVRGERVLPPISRELLDDAGRRLKPEELPILGMTIENTPLLDIALTLVLEPVEVTHRIDRMIKRLKIDIPAPRIAQ